MKRLQTLYTVTLFAVLTTLAGCQGQVITDNVRNPLNNVCDRHDIYVKADTGNTKVEKAVYLDESAKIRDTIKANPKTFKAAHIDAELQAVTLRHDNYIENDARLIKLEKDIMLRDTALLREIFKRAQNRKE